MTLRRTLAALCFALVVIGGCAVEQDTPEAAYAAAMCFSHGDTPADARQVTALSAARAADPARLDQDRVYAACAQRLDVERLPDWRARAGAPVIR
jgi:hypothetical protein